MAAMISVEEARKLVFDHASTICAKEVTIRDALNLVLAESVKSDIDSPPFDKALVDGFAVRSEDFAKTDHFTVIEEIPAGATPQKPITPGTAARIMTGAPIPTGADSVVMVERTRIVSDTNDKPDRVKVLEKPNPNDGVMRQAVSLRRNATVLQPGTLLRAIEIGLLAEVGRATAAVYPKPSVAVLATGDELVSPDSVPLPGQIRNSNESMLCALADRAFAVPVPLGVSRDDRQELVERISFGLKHDVLVLSGGVSAGKYDYVPSVFESLGVRQVFHKVNLKPGKPLWFGVKELNDRATLVFGLPGNPVSGLVCFELFARPALARLRGLHDGTQPETQQMVLQERHQQSGQRPTYFPARWKYRHDGSRTVRTLDWKGSADLCTLARANCLAYFPAGDHTFQPGQPIPVIPI